MTLGTPGDRPRPEGLGPWGQAFWVALALTLLWLRVQPSLAARLEHDSFQYLSIAANALQGHLGATSLIHFDAERSFGVVPAPMVTFPVGYPLALAAVAATGLSLAQAALALGMLATVVNVLLLARLAHRLGLSLRLGHAVLALFALNGVVIQFGVTALTESLFSCLVLLGLALLAGPRSGAVGWRSWVGAGLAFGAAYFVRYAGLFFIAGLMLLAAWHWLARRREAAVGYGVASAAALAVVAVGVVRNLVLVGHWRGRDEMALSQPLLQVLSKAAGSFNLLFLGPSSGPDGSRLLPKVLLCLLLLVGVAWLVLQAWRGRARCMAAEAPTPFAFDLLVLTLAYALGMLYAGLSSSISFGLPRNFLPVAGPVLLLGGVGLKMLWARAVGSTAWPAAAALSAALAVYAGLQLQGARLPPADRAAPVVRLLDAPDLVGPTPRAFLASLPAGTIVANNGQAVGYLLGRPTVSLVGPAFSQTRWDEATLREAVRRFRAVAVVISLPDAGEPEADVFPSPFVRRLAQAEPPAWLGLTYRSPRVLVYRPNGLD
jgi:hypothetical protein